MSPGGASKPLEPFQWAHLPLGVFLPLPGYCTPIAREGPNQFKIGVIEVPLHEGGAAYSFRSSRFILAIASDSVTHMSFVEGL